MAKDKRLKIKEKELLLIDGSSFCIWNFLFTKSISD